MPRATLIRVVAAIIVVTVVTSVVMLIPDWNGIQASSEAGPIDTLMNVMIVLSSFVFAIVMVMLVYSVWKYRAKPGDESDGAPIHGSAKLEITWTLIPTIIVLFGAGYSWIVLDNIEAREPDRLKVEVTGQQFKFSFQYPEEGIRSNELHVPIDRQVEFEMTALDVVHAFWVPEWRMKKDLVPGIVTSVSATPDRLGTYSLVCAELCGLGHSTMRSPVVVESTEDFERWVGEQDEIPEGEEGLPLTEIEPGREAPPGGAQPRREAPQPAEEEGPAPGAAGRQPAGVAG